jgi:hypothetical protein
MSKYEYQVQPTHQDINAASDTLFQQFVNDSNHKLHQLLPSRNNSSICTKWKHFFQLPPLKVTEFKHAMEIFSKYTYYGNSMDLRWK